MMKLALRLALPLVLALAPAACAIDAVDADEDVASSEESALKDLTITPLDVRREGGEPGVTVIRSKAAYADFFGQAPPDGTNFRRHWVVHVRGVPLRDPLGISRRS